MQTDITKTGSESAQPLLFNAPLPSSPVRLTVIVPARNEAHQLIDTLEALRKQQDGNKRPLNPALYDVLLLANNCTDASFDVAVQYQQQHPDFQLHVIQIQLPPDKANIGTVRRLLMDEACRRLTSAGQLDGIIASTDGDTIVDSRWVYTIMLEMAKGNDAVGGRILTRPEQSNVRLFHLRDVMYRTLIAKAEAQVDPCSHDPWPRHFQHFGASIAVTCRMYQQVGGLPEIPYLEDEAFYRALLRVDAKVRKSPHVKVYTSTRLQGRVAVGFSEQLRYWSTMSQANQCQLAEPANAVIARLNNRQRLRLCWQKRNQGSQTDALTHIALELRIDPDWLIDQFKKSHFFGEVWEKIDERMTSGQWMTQWKPVPITVAIRDMRAFLVM